MTTETTITETTEADFVTCVDNGEQVPKSEAFFAVDSEEYYSKSDELFFAVDTEEYYADASDLCYAVDTEEYYADASDLYYAVDSEEYYADANNLYFVYDIEEYHRSNRNLVHCEDINEWVESDYVYVQDLDVYYHSTDDLYEHNGDWYAESPKACAEYHHYKGQMRDFGGKWQLGAEIERTDDMEDFAGYFGGHRDIFDKYGLAFERDGSVSYELITPILNGDETQYAEYINSVSELINYGDFDSSCGGHIHLSNRFMTPFELWNTNVRHWASIIGAMYIGRKSNEYCKIEPYEKVGDTGRYTAFNLTRNTLEFRVIGAVRNAKQLIWRMETILLFAKKCEELKQNGIDLTFEHMLDVAMANPEHFLRDNLYTPKTFVRMLERAISIEEEFGGHTEWDKAKALEIVTEKRLNA